MTTTQFFPSNNFKDLPELRPVPNPDMGRVTSLRPSLAGSTPLQITRFLRESGLAEWPLALHAYQDPSVAFRVTTGEDWDRARKIAFYSDHYGLKPADLDRHLDRFERTLVFGSPQQVAQRQRELDAEVDWVESMRAGKSSEQLAQEYIQAALQDPATAQQIQEFAKANQLDPEAAAASLPQIKEMLEAKGFAKTILDSPRTRNLLEDPANLAVLHDSVLNLTRLESALVSRHGTLGEQISTRAVGMWRNLQRGAAGQAVMGNEILNQFGKLIGSGFLQRYTEADIQRARRFAEDIAKRTVVLTEEAGGAKGFLADLSGSILQLGSFAAMGLVNPALPLATIGTMVSGNQYMDSRLAGSSILQGVLTALPTAGVSTALEAFQIKSVLKLAGVKASLRKFGQEQVGLLAKELATQWSQELLQNVVEDVGAMAGVAGTEGAIEAGTFGEKLWGSVTQGAYEGTLAALTGLLFAVPSLPRIWRGIRDVAEGQAWDTRVAMAEASMQEAPVTTRDPNTAAQAVGKILREDPEAVSSLPAGEVASFFQGQPLLLEDFLRKIGVTPEVFQEALRNPETGRIEFSTGRWLTDISATSAGASLRKYLRIGSHPTLEETAALMEEVTANAKEASDLLVEMATTEEPTPESLLQFRRDLVAKGGLSAEGADYAIQLLVYGLRRAAKLQDVPLEQLAKRLNLRLFVEGKDAMLLPGKRWLTAQGEDMTGARGATTFAKGETVVQLFAHRDISTIYHEIGHVLLSEFSRTASQAGEGDLVRTDLAALEAFAGGRLPQPGEPITPELTRRVERVVEGWTAWLEGQRAPAPGLAWAFHRLSRWLSQLYTTIKRYVQPAEINPELAQVYSRWLATEEEMRAAEAYYQAGGEVSALLLPPGKEEEGEGKAQKASPRPASEREEAAHQRALARLAKAKEALIRAREKALADEVRRRAAEWRKRTGGQKAIRARATQEVKGRPVYRALEAIRSREVTSETADGVLVRRAAGISPEVLLELQWDDGKTTVLPGDGPNVLPGGLAELLIARHGKGVVGSGIQSIRQLADLGRRFEFHSARELLQALLEAPPIEEAIRARADEIEQEAIREIRSEVEADMPPGTPMVHTDADLEHMLADLEVLAAKVERLRGARLTKAAIQGTRDRIRQHLMERLPLRQAWRISRWAQIEAKLATQAFNAARKGDAETAYQARRQQLIYHLMVQEAAKLRNEAKKQIRRLGKTPSEKIEEGYRRTLVDLLTTYQLLKGPPPPWADPVKLVLPPENFETSKDGAEGDERLKSLLADAATVLPEWVRTKVLPPGPQTATNPGGVYQGPQDLTFAQLEMIAAAAAWLETAGQKELRALLSERYKTLEELAQGSIQAMAALPDLNLRDPRTVRGAFQTGTSKAAAILTMTEFLFERADGSPLLHGKAIGPLHQVFQRIAARQAEMMLRWKKLIEGEEGKYPGLKEAFQALVEEQETVEKRLGGPIFQLPGRPMIEVLKQKRGYGGMSFDMLLAIALNMGNDANRYALLNCEYKLTEADLDLVAQQFSKAGWKAIQQIWDTVNSLFPELEGVRYRLTQTKPPKEPAVPFSVVTSDGESLTMKGGYYPLVYDPLVNDRNASSKEIANILEEARKAAFWGRGQMATGFAQARHRRQDDTPAVELPPLLSSSVLMSHLRDVTTFIYMAEPLQEMHWLTRHDGWRETFIRKFGREHYQALRRWINYQARPERRRLDWFSNFLEFGRKRFVTATLGLKLFTGVKQRLSMINAVKAMNEAGKGGTGYVLKGMALCGFGGNTIGRPTQEMLDFVHALSARMAARRGNMDRDLRDFVNTMRREGLELEIAKINKQLNAAVLSMSRLQEIAFAWIRANDMAAVYPVWVGAYYQAMEQRLNGITEQTSEEEAKQKAAAYADAIISMSQPAGMPVDLAELQRLEGPWRLMVVFMSWRLKALNRLMWHATDPNLTFAEEVGYFMTEWVLPALVWMMAPALVYADEDKPKWWDYMLRPGFDILGSAPIASEIVSGLRFGTVPFHPFDFTDRMRVALDKATGVNVDYQGALFNLWRTLEWFAGLPASNITTDVLRVAAKIEGEK